MASTNMTAEERTERARAAANSRWADQYNWDEVPLDEAVVALADLRAELARAQEIVNRRVDIANMREPAFCYNPDCRKPIDLATGQWAGRRDRHDLETGQIESAYACSTRCWQYLTANFTVNPQATSNRKQPHAGAVGLNESAALAIEHKNEQPVEAPVPAATVPVVTPPKAAATVIAVKGAR